MSPHLTFDIQVEIIKRLPVKSLIQFRWVCKAWKSLIDSSQFIAGYNVPHDQPQQLMIRYEEENEVKYVCFVDDDTFPQPKFFPTIPHLAPDATVIGSSHGLLCLDGYLQEPDGSSTTPMAVIWNPAISKSIGVVVPNAVYMESDNVIGFGVCPDTKDLKLVNITYPDYEDLCQVMVFTLSSGEWRCLSSNHLPRISLEFDNSCQTVIGQFIYWVVYDRFEFDSDSDGEMHLIMSFDLSTDEFREVHLPYPLCTPYLSISRLRESLVVLDHRVSSTTHKQVCDVWMMEDGDPKEFTKLFTIKAPDVSVLSTLGFRNNGEAIIRMQYDDDEDFYARCAVVYGPCLEHIKDLGIRGHRYSFYGSCYMESLLLLDHDDGHIVKCGAVKS